jgi:hypothetical protein
MEGRQVPVDVRESREPSALRITQVGLLIASLGAALVIFGIFGLGVVGLVLCVVGAALAAPGGMGKGWYWAVVVGAIVAVLSRFIAESAETLGGWLAVFGGIAILIGASLGFPVRNEREG